jgi:ABC-type antimicrobial peptide transport system permease subunit
MFGNENPLGQHFRFGPGNRDVEVVGVSKTVRYAQLKQDYQPVVYLGYSQGVMPLNQMVYEVRTAGNPLNFVNTIREIIHQADSRVPMYQIRTQESQIDQLMNQEIVFARLCTAFALLGLIIACVGLYGSTAYNIARRTNEIGIRMALGAARAGVIWMVLRQVLIMAVVGLALGLPIAYASSQLVESFLFGMKPNDPRAIAAAVAVLLAAAFAAGFWPARKASRIDPMNALRHE